MYTKRIATEWIKLGHSVTLFCASVPGLSSDEVIEEVRTIRRGSKHSVYREAKRFYRREGRGHFDLVIDEVNTRPFLAPKWVNDTPVIALIHQVCREVWFYEYRLPVALVGRFILEPWWLRSYRNIPVVTVSKSSMESLGEYGLRNISVVPEGMDQIDHLPPIEHDSVPTVLFVGRLTANKRPADAIEAFRLLLRNIPTARMWIIGTGPMEHRLRRSAPSGVEFFGRVSESEKREKLARSSVLIVTSVREGWGLVVTEAAQYGTISVGYDVPGLRDSIAASGGLLVPPSPEQLSSAIEVVLREKSDVVRSRVNPNGVTPWVSVAQQILEISVH